MAANALTVGDLFAANGEALQLQWVAGQDQAERRVASLAETPGKALVGYLNPLHPNRVQVIGRHELAHLEQLEPAARQALIEGLLAAWPAMMVVTEGLAPPADLLAAAEAAHSPLFTSPLPSTRVISWLRHYLNDELAERQVVHGVFLEVHGLGVLISGASGVGKSELALELISRNHRLVADDAPEFSRLGPGTVRGHCPAVLQDFLEVRGLGLLDIRAMYGASAIRMSKYLGLVVHLQRMSVEELSKLNRLEGSYQVQRILDVEIPRVTVPVAPGRNLAVLVEAAVRNHILLHQGYNAPQAFIERQQKLLQKNSQA